MTKKFPSTPFPLIGEIVYECAVRSGLVSSSEEGKVYADLKAFKDDRKRPGLRLGKLPQTLLVKLEERLAAHTGSKMYAALTFTQIRRALEFYNLCIADADATLLTREQVVDEILWPTLFSAAAATCLEPLDRIHHVTDLKAILADANPFGRFLKGLCVRGAQDYRLIYEHRARHHDIDPENCEQTLRTWLNGSAVPALDSCNDILEALGMAHDSGTRQWTLVARLLAKTAPAHRTHILHRVTYEPLAPVETQFQELRRAVNWRAGTKLSIGADRPFLKIRNALYDPDAPRDPQQIEDMLQRLKVTWEPIADQTQQVLDWLWGRYLVLSAKYEDAFDRYQSSYEQGLGRDRDILERAIPELVALAGKLGRWRAAEKYHDVAMLYGKADWDGMRASMPAYFEMKFASELFFQEN